MEEAQAGLGRTITGKEGREREFWVDTGMEVNKHKLYLMGLGHRYVTGTLGAECAGREGWRVRWVICHLTTFFEHLPCTM